MGLYAEWKKLRDDVQSASARLYSEKNENTERKYEEALERLAQFEKENGIPLMADEADVKKMFCPQTNEEWLKSLNTDEFADFLEGVAFDSNFRNGIEAEYRREDKDYCYGDRPKIIKAWLKEVHK